MQPTEQSSDDIAQSAPYPEHWEADVVLRDGTPVHVRPIRPSDKDALQAFHVAQSERSIYFRFFSAMERLSEKDLSRFTETDNTDRVALIATLTRHHAAEAIVGVARFDRIAPDEAEVAFNISDTLQGRGLGSVLLEHVAAAAREVGVRKFYAEVLPQNGKMLSVFKEAGYQQAQTVDDGIVTVTVDLDPTEQSVHVMAQREYRAEARSMQRLYAPNKILLIGSLTDEPTPEEIRLATGALASGIGVKGDEKLHVVGLPPGFIREAQDRGEQADNFVHYPSLEDLIATGQSFDLAVLTIPDSAVAQVLMELAPLGVHAAVLLTGGFAENGTLGLALQREVIRVAHSAGIRIIGPASYGLFSNTAQHPFNASLVPQRPPHGGIGLFCQSSAIAVTLLSTVTRRQLGVSNFLASGNRADISGNDLMQFWQEDTSSTSVGMYLESIGNPRKFSRIARRLSRIKPIVAVSAGQTGYVVPRGHAVSPTHAPRKTLDQMLKQSGVIRAQNTHELVDTLQFFETQPLPQGKRVGIIANSEALAAIAAEAAHSALLEVTEHIHVLRSLDNPNDPQQVLDAVYGPHACDIVILAYVPTIGEFPKELAHTIATMAANTQRPTIASVYGLHGVTEPFTVHGPHGPLSVPAYSTPEDAIRALKNVVGYAQWLAEDHGQRVHFDDIDRHKAAALIATVGAGLTPQEETTHILKAYGIDLWPSYRVHTVEQAQNMAAELGYPVVLKSSAESLRHRADLGGVRLNIANSTELVEDFSDMVTELSRHLGTDQDVLTIGFDIQAMAATGVACVIRSQEDPLYGPVVSFGLSGDAVDLLDDVSYAIPPLTQGDIHTMVRSVGAAPKLFGYKGLPAADVEKLEELIARISLLSDNHPEIKALELYPVIVADDTVAVISASLEISPARRKDGLRRTLPQ